jgi:hypothetical protein
MSTTGATRAKGPRLPTLAELNRATLHTAAVIADPASTALDRYRAAEAEEATALAFGLRPGGQTEADLESWLEAGSR